MVNSDLDEECLLLQIWVHVDLFGVHPFLQQRVSMTGQHHHQRIRSSHRYGRAVRATNPQLLPHHLHHPDAPTKLA